MAASSTNEDDLADRPQRMNDTTNTTEPANETASDIQISARRSAGDARSMLPPGMGQQDAAD